MTSETLIKGRLHQTPHTGSPISQPGSVSDPVQRTPLTEDSLLDARRNNFLVSVAEAESALALAWIDVSTGDFHTQPVDAAGLNAVLAGLDAGEVLVSESLLQQPSLFETWREWKERLTPLPASRFDSINGEKRLQSLFAVGTLDAYGNFGRSELAAAGALVEVILAFVGGHGKSQEAPREAPSPADASPHLPMPLPQPCRRELCRVGCQGRVDPTRPRCAYLARA